MGPGAVTTLAPAAATLACAAATLACAAPPPAPDPPGAIAFAVMGDAPYYWWEEQRYEHLVDALNRDSLDWVIHVGDVFWIPCSDAKMIERREALQRIRHPVVFTPGDNEWTDCWGPREGGFAPLERLRSLRDIYYPEPGRTLGGRAMPVEYQAADSTWGEFVENQRWRARGVVFATVHLVGSRNAGEAFPGRGEADDAEARRRTSAATAWLIDTFARARADSARAVVIAMHAAPGLEEPPEDDYRRAYEPFVETLEREVAAFAGPVLLAHGDDHDYVVDTPLKDRRTGELLERFTRLQVMGSPEVGWVRVTIDTAGPTFRFVPRRIPGWKLW